MKLKMIFLVLAVTLGIAPFTVAQILITPQVPPQGLIQKNQLWNILIINQTGATRQVQVKLSLTDGLTGQQLLLGSGRTLVLPPGATQLREPDIAPIQYNYTGAYASLDRSPGDLLMAGVYIACYTLIENNGKGFETQIAEECLNTEVEPVSPPQLISPADTSVVETNYPYFNWIPPAPATMFANLQYEIRIAELKKGQSSDEAIQRNTPIYIQRYLSTPYLLYPASYTKLERGKSYAWQVIAKNGNVYTQKTEAWSFKIKEDSASIIIDNGMYAKLRKGFDAQSYICKGDMRFTYQNESGDTAATVSIYTIQGDMKHIADTRKVKLRQGQNFVDLKIGNNGKYQDTQVYILELQNSRNEKWQLKFKYERKD